VKTQLSAQQIAAYRENGFVVIEEFLTTEELEEWRGAVDEAVSHRRGAALPDRGQVGEPENPPQRDAKAKAEAEYYGAVFIQRINLWQDNARMRRIMLNPDLGKMICDLEGIDGVRIWHDQALIKEPWGNPTAWHLDNPYWSFSSRHSISIWVALDHATPENGCMYFIPGSHKLATFDNSGIGMNMRALFDVYPEMGKLDSACAAMRAGSCSFHNGLTAHGAGANMTRGYRRAMTCAYMPDGSTFNGQRNILTKDQIGRLKKGDVLDDNEQNPLIFSYSKPHVNATA
jgi:phytanoyl-CoA hydroxylase